MSGSPCELTLGGLFALPAANDAELQLAHLDWKEIDIPGRASLALAP